MSASKNKQQSYLWQKIAILVVGFILSIVLHELFHIVLHYGEITSISFFQGGSIAEMVVMEHNGEDLDGEEFAAYFITVLVVLTTVMAIYKITDMSDPRTVKQILFSGHTPEHTMKTAEFNRLVGRTDLVSQKPKSRSKVNKRN